MGVFQSKNRFPVKGRTVLITGGSQGLGRSVARLLASKGANIVIVARNVNKLQEAIAYIAAGATGSETQKFHYISADLTSPADCIRIFSEVHTWNNNSPPDIVWCVAGSSHPTLFIDTPMQSLRDQMDSNYFSSAYTAHAALRAWLKPKVPIAPTDKGKVKETYHLIFTSSVVAFYPIMGYSHYSPTKAALRSLSDSLSQELNLYLEPGLPVPPVRIHTVFPGTILTESYETEDRMKPEVTKELEKDDPRQTPDAVALAAVRSLEKGDELVTTNWLGWAMMCSTLAASKRNGWGVLDTVGAWIVVSVMGFVRWFMDGTVKNWGRKHGSSGNRKAH
ncbi:MAG: hypothetical protein MMC33_007843 [Icmadophila ericetorum]|nr:hypothetical protein [Icmadophila ericetorum]